MPAPKHSLEAGASGQPSLSAPALRSPGMRADPGRNGALAPAPRCPARFCQPGLPCPHPGTPPPLRRPTPPSGRRRRGCFSTTKGPHRVGGWRRGRRALRPVGRAPQKAGAGPDPWRPRRTPGMPDPGADEQAGLAQAAGARGVVAGTYLSLRRRRVRVAACRPRGRALEPHTAPLARPRCRTPRARAAAAAAHTLGPARGRRGLLNPDRTTAPGRGAQGGPSGSARGRGGPPLPEPRERPSSAAPPRRAAGVPPPTHRSETTLPSPRAMAASGARAPQPAASRHQGTRARPRLNPFGLGVRAGLGVAQTPPGRREACPRPPAAGSQHHPPPLAPWSRSYRPSPGRNSRS